MTAGVQFPDWHQVQLSHLQSRSQEEEVPNKIILLFQTALTFPSSAPTRDMKDAQPSPQPAVYFLPVAVHKIDNRALLALPCAQLQPTPSRAILSGQGGTNAWAISNDQCNLLVHFLLLGDQTETSAWMHYSLIKP